MFFEAGSTKFFIVELLSTGVNETSLITKGNNFPRNFDIEEEVDFETVRPIIFRLFEYAFFW